jgi:hypothetical protein
MAVRRPRRVLVMLGMGLTEKALFKKSGIYRESEGGGDTQEGVGAALQ